MSGSAIAFLVAEVLGGLALFILGMKTMSEGLQRAAGNRLRGLLYHLTRNRFAGITVGTVVGFLVHSSAATVMLVGFINAGLMSLTQSIAVILGANVGTTLSMQVVSFKLDEYCYFAVAIGLLLQLAGRKDLLKNLGSVVLGFGLLFLGMKTMSAGVAPLKGGPLEEILRQADAATWGGLLLGLLLSTLITGVVQSSGATVGVLFALSSAGVFTQLSQVFPLLLGAHIGTCATALLGSIGTNIEARRAAVTHLLFNVLGAALAIAMLRFYLWVIPLTADDLVRQIANAHTLIQLVNALVVLPFVGLFARLVELVSPSKAPPPERSHLRDRYLSTPEMAMVAGLRETQRMARMTRRQLTGAIRALVERSVAPLKEVRKTEEAVDALKDSIRAYLFRVAAHRLSKRQSILVQHVLTSVNDLERIGDHATVLAELSQERSSRGIWFDDDSMASVLEHYRQVSHVLELTWRSLESQLAEDARKELAQAILAARSEAVAHSERIRAAHQDLVRRKEVDPLTGLFFARVVSCLDKIVKHSEAIAIAELQPVFFVKEHKLKKESPLLPRHPMPHPDGVKVDESLFEEP